MSTPAQKKAHADRATASEELNESIRQAQRYLDGARPSTRLIKQKMEKVIAMEQELRRCHFASCNLEEIPLDSDEARKYIGPKMDESADCVDKCMLAIEDHESSDASDEKNATIQNEQAQFEEKFQGVVMQMTSDEKFATDMRAKIKRDIEWRKWTHTVYV